MLTSSETSSYAQIVKWWINTVFHETFTHIMTNTSIKSLKSHIWSNTKTGLSSTALWGAWVQKYPLYYFPANLQQSLHPCFFQRFRHILLTCKLMPHFLSQAMLRIYGPPLEQQFTKDAFHLSISLPNSVWSDISISFGTPSQIVDRQPVCELVSSVGVRVSCLQWLLWPRDQPARPWDQQS